MIKVDSVYRSSDASPNYISISNTSKKHVMSELSFVMSTFIGNLPLQIWNFTFKLFIDSLVCVFVWTKCQMKAASFFFLCFCQIVAFHACANIQLSVILNQRYYDVILFHVCLFATMDQIFWSWINVTFRLHHFYVPSMIKLEFHKYFVSLTSQSTKIFWDRVMSSLLRPYLEKHSTQQIYS